VIFIVVKFQVDESSRDRWPALTRAFTDATRAEPGNLWFEWSQGLDDPNEYVLVEAFRDAEAGSAHVGAEPASARSEIHPRQRDDRSADGQAERPQVARWCAQPVSSSARRPA
jgi:quinol monooxygenase YgiN